MWALGPSPFSKTPAPAFKSELYALNERKRWGSEREKQGQGPQNMAPAAHMAGLSHLNPKFSHYHMGHGLYLLKFTCISNKILFSDECEKFFH